jgi:hypothetical protein
MFIPAFCTFLITFYYSATIKDSTGIIINESYINAHQQGGFAKIHLRCTIKIIYSKYFLEEMKNHICPKSNAMSGFDN